MHVPDWKQDLKADGGGWHGDDVVDLVGDASRRLESEVVACEAVELSEKSEVANK